VAGRGGGPGTGAQFAIACASEFERKLVKVVAERVPVSAIFDPTEDLRDPRAGK